MTIDLEVGISITEEQAEEIGLKNLCQKYADYEIWVGQGERKMKRALLLRKPNNQLEISHLYEIGHN